MAKKPCGIWKVKDVPQDKVGQTIAGFNLQKAISVTPQEQGDGKWTVIAVFPDCAPGKANLTEKTAG